MSDDIVERLRARADNVWALKADAIVMREAADEIERLQLASRPPVVTLTEGETWPRKKA